LLHEGGDPRLDRGELLADQGPAGDELGDLEPSLRGGLGEGDGVAGRGQENSGAMVKGAAFVVDLVDPLSVLQNVVDVKEAIVGSEASRTDEKKPSD
jgi:hypothetical protein